MTPDLTTLAALEARIAELEKLVRNAYHEGFTEGMREHTSSKGGKVWSESGAFRALQSKEEKPE